jgi:hypothetical protein
MCYSLVLLITPFLSLVPFTTCVLYFLNKKLWMTPQNWSSERFLWWSSILGFRTEYSVNCQTESKTKICFGFHKPRPIPTRPYEILINFRSDVLLPLSVQTLFSNHVFSDICSRKVCVLKYEGRVFQFSLSDPFWHLVTWPGKNVLTVCSRKKWCGKIKSIRLIQRSRWSSNYGKTLFRLIEMNGMYFDTSLKTSRRG